MQWISDKYLLPRFGAVQAAKITRRDVHALLDSVATTRPVMANRILALVRKMFNWGVEKDIVEMNPCYSISAPGKETPRERVLTKDELKQAWQILGRQNEGNKGQCKMRMLSACILKLLLLTAQRPGEVMSMEWTELDLETRWWTIPGNKTKNGLSHRVPLSVWALRIIEEARDLCSHNPSQFVFPGPRGGHIANIKKAVERIKAVSGIDFNAHDLRRTAASLMTGMEIPRLVVSKILNHVEPGVTAVCDRHGYDNEKREALEEWSRRLSLIVSDLKEVKSEA